jgi:transcriptional regulator with XRE-family HTH domain
MDVLRKLIYKGQQWTVRSLEIEGRNPTEEYLQKSEKDAARIRRDEYRQLKIARAHIISMSTKPKSLAQRFETASQGLEFEIETAKLQFTEEMLEIMEKTGVSRTKLAGKLNVKPARITALLRGSNNFRLETMIRICRALRVRYRHHIEGPGCVTTWSDIPMPAHKQQVRGIGEATPVLDASALAFALSAGKLKIETKAADYEDLALAA